MIESLDRTLRPQVYDPGADFSAEASEVGVPCRHLPRSIIEYFQNWHHVDR